MNRIHFIYCDTVEDSNIWLVSQKRVVRVQFPTALLS